MEQILHAIGRGALHIVCAPFSGTAIYLLLRYWGRHNSKVGTFISGRRSHLVFVSALLDLNLMTLREPIDAAFGWQVWWKGPTDQLSWVIGIGLWVWYMYREPKLQEDTWGRI